MRRLMFKSTGSLVGLMALVLLSACNQTTETPFPPQTSAEPSASFIAVPQLSDARKRMALVRPAVEQAPSATVSIAVEPGLLGAVGGTAVWAWG